MHKKEKKKKKIKDNICDKYWVPCKKCPNNGKYFSKKDDMYEEKGKNSKMGTY